MGRAAEGPTVHFKRGWAYSRFTWKGVEYNKALGTRDEREAAEASARFYAKVVSGQHTAVRKQPGKFVDIADALDLWLESKRTSIDVDFFPTLEGYARRFVHYFGSLGDITEASSSTYGLDRLGQTLRTTTLRELSYLRQFLAWCKLHGVLSSVPVVPKLPPKAKGVRTGTQRAKSVYVTPDEAKAILDALPVESKTIDGRRWPLRARFALMWETALRPETLSRLRVPDNWRPGMGHLELTDEDDKARWGREVGLTPAALRILAKTAPKAGLIFGDHNYSKHLKAAARAILGPVRGKGFAPYDFRHGRAKERLDAGAALRGVAYMLGHKRLSTTDKYLAPDRMAGDEAIGVPAKRGRGRVQSARPKPGPKTDPKKRRTGRRRRSEGKEG